MVEKYANIDEMSPLVTGAVSTVPYDDSVLLLSEPTDISINNDLLKILIIGSFFLLCCMFGCLSCCTLFVATIIVMFIGIVCSICVGISTLFAFIGGIIVASLGYLIYQQV